MLLRDFLVEQSINRFSDDFVRRASSATRLTPIGSTDQRLLMIAQIYCSPHVLDEVRDIKDREDMKDVLAAAMSVSSWERHARKNDHFVVKHGKFILEAKLEHPKKEGGYTVLEWTKVKMTWLTMPEVREELAKAQPSRKERYVTMQLQSAITPSYKCALGGDGGSK